MNKITFPLKPNMRGPAVADLQDALRLLLDRGALLAAAAARQELAAAIQREREPSSFGKMTAQAVLTYQQERKLQPTGKVDEQTAALLTAEIEAEPPPPLAEKPFVVQGTVRFADGRPVVGVLVRASDKDLRREELLGEATTDRDGRYAITYTAQQFRRAEKDHADLRVGAYTQAGREMASSPVRFNAAADETVDLVAGDEVYRGPSEYDRLVRELTPLLDGLTFAELTEDQEHQDVTHLSGETEQDPVRIAFLIKAQRLMQKTDVQAEVFYGLLPGGAAHGIARAARPESGYTAPGAAASRGQQHHLPSIRS